MIELHSINAFNMNKMSGLFSYHSPHRWSDTCVFTISFTPNCMELYHSSIHINNVLNPNVWNSIAPYSSIHRKQIQLNSEKTPIKILCAFMKLYTSYYCAFYLFSKHCSLKPQLESILYFNIWSKLLWTHLTAHDSPTNRFSPANLINIQTFKTQSWIPNAS